MSDQIKPGDLVMVVKPTPCCNVDNAIGKIFKVNSIYSGRIRCLYCRKISHIDASARTGGKGGCGVTRLKKLNPPEREESRETAKELEVA